MGPEEAPALPVLLGDTEVVANAEALRVQVEGMWLASWSAAPHGVMRLVEARTQPDK